MCLELPVCMNFGLKIFHLLAFHSGTKECFCNTLYMCVCVCFKSVSKTSPNAFNKACLIVL